MTYVKKKYKFLQFDYEPKYVCKSPLDSCNKNLQTIKSKKQIANVIYNNCLIPRFTLPVSFCCLIKPKSAYSIGDSLKIINVPITQDNAIFFVGVEVDMICTHKLLSSTGLLALNFIIF
ncbi:hypothetical protein RCL_jg16997.t1 [Rhizophagus clarus]|uniref:Uncharacterized protein n=1 Tax=Rhizophagus clarus TaxID=94130 RepID=A0A8H3QRE8_9GLOM|nr:hypothetical protein RCL_jg16997.t1 [Rhizophagus clarus]